MDVGKYFSLHEFIKSTKASKLLISNQPNSLAIDNMCLLCNTVLDPIRAVVGPVRITSGYRCEDLNKAIGGAENSRHIYGLAADFKVKNFLSHQLVELIRRLPNLPIDKCIAYSKDTGGHVHIQIANPVEKGRYLFYKCDSSGYHLWE